MTTTNPDHNVCWICKENNALINEAHVALAELGACDDNDIIDLVDDDNGGVIGQPPPPPPPEGDAADDVQHGGSSGWSIGSERWNNALGGFEPAPPQRADAERGGAVPCRPLCRSRSRGRAIDPCPVDRPHPFR